MLAHTQRSTYAPNEPITIEYSGLPGNAQDWIAVVKRTDPDGTHGTWEYTGGKRSGTITLAAGLAAGDYEVRVMFDWPSGGYTVHSRSKFSVGSVALPSGPAPSASGNLARAQQSSYTPGQPVVIEYSGLPGNAQDWVAIVKRGDPDNTNGTWEYTGGKRSGTITIPAGFAAGDYEVRVLFDWPAGGYNIRSRSSFRVGARGEPIDDVPILGPMIRAPKVYSPTEEVAIDFFNFQGTTGDWIAIVNPTDPDNTNGTWAYTGGGKSGTLKLGRLAPGEYEARAYFNWPDGGHTVRARTRLTVR